MTSSSYVPRNGIRLQMPNYDPPEPTPPPPAPTAPPWMQPPAPAVPQFSIPEPPAPEKPAPQPAMTGLGAISNVDKFREQINSEGWADEQSPQFDIPGAPGVPPSTRALAELAGQRGRVY